jgi:putative ABC transport system permease protein
MSRLTGWLVGWRLALRLARREALRSRARSLLSLAMIALPVLAVTAADVAFSTTDVNAAESLDRRLGTAGAEIALQDGTGRVFQGADPDTASFGGNRRPGEAATGLDDVRRVLGGAGPVLARRESGIRFTTENGVGSAEAAEIDLRDPLAHGLVRLDSGRLPRTATEIVVNRALAERGFAVGDELPLVTSDGAVGAGVDGGPTIVGIAESTTVRDYPYAAGPIGSLRLDTGGARAYLVAGTVTWPEVLALNRLGATVLSRQVVEHPPSDDEIPARVRDMQGGGSSSDAVTIAVLVVVMALLEVVLLAGPAFAVGARRQSRQLALMASTGATPVQTRRVVLAGGVVLGAAAAVVGVVLGIGVAAGLLPLLQLKSGSWFGPFEVAWSQLLVVACFGLLSAVLAAVVPAWIASRQDVVAVLGGRRGDRAPSRRSPARGVALLGVAVAMATFGARHVSSALIAGSAVVSVLAMILLVPLAVAVLARVCGRLRLVRRYAVRDAARHRTRTVPAVAAVAATVAGVVALGIATSSDETENRERNVPSLAAGVGVVNAYGRGVDWAGIEGAARRAVPGATVAAVRGVPESYDGTGGIYVSVRSVGSPGSPGTGDLLSSYGGSLGASFLVSDGQLPVGLVGLTASARTATERALAAGRSVAFTDLRGGAPVETELKLRREELSEGDAQPQVSTTRVAGLVVPLAFSQGGPAGILPPAAARRAALPVSTVGVELSGTTITAAQEKDLGEAVTARASDSSVYVERGYVASSEAVILQLVLAGLGAVLMLGGTLTATFLALSDARPDLATLSAVGASPRTRRGIAAAYALVVGVVGAALGAVVGFVPGLAIAYPLTYQAGDVLTSGKDVTHLSTPAGGALASGPFIDVPWLMVVGLVVGLPLLTALVVGLVARSRLPLVARLS